MVGLGLGNGRLDDRWLVMTAPIVLFTVALPGMFMFMIEVASRELSTSRITLSSDLLRSAVISGRYNSVKFCSRLWTSTVKA